MDTLRTLEDMRAAIVGLLGDIAWEGQARQHFVIALDSAEEYYTSLMEIAAPVQNLMAKLSDGQKQEVKQRITQAASNYRRADRITFPIAVRMVAGRKPF